MIYILAFVPFALVLICAACFFLCEDCEERRRQQRAEDRQLRVARELFAQARREREAKQAGLVFVRVLNTEAGLKRGSQS